MISKVCLITDWNRYNEHRHFIAKLVEALRRKGVETMVVDSERKPLKAENFFSFETNPPEFTCSFNKLEKTNTGEFIWDVFKLPHVAFTLEPSFYSIDLIKSNYSIISCSDRFEAAALQTQFARVFFFPPGIEQDIVIDDKVERTYPVVFFGSCYDYEAYQKDWEKKLPKELWKVLDFAIDLVFTNNTISLADALGTAWVTSHLDVSLGKEYLLVMCHYLHRYVSGKDRVELIRSIRDAEVHIFGADIQEVGNDGKGWAEYVGDCPNVKLHAPVDFSDSLDILKQSKICLNSTPSSRNGAHARVFAGAACGALVLSSESLYLRETLSDGEDILYYRSKHWNDVNAVINDYLADGKKLNKVAKSGRSKVMEHHTWDHRIELLQPLVP